MTALAHQFGYRSVSDFATDAGLTVFGFLIVISIYCALTC